ncbi:DUF2231 domain-containing protein [Nocardia sp. CA-128927]|uniref:DUF2231 domain-containing protein n=1 Tax=Nocardia sp. CA-128927 TaxID=3239975 RepID=UPI003D97833A
MSTINGLPAHVLLVHIIVVFVPLTAALLILSALWAAARRRLVWLVAVLAVVTTVLTPVTTDAGEWLEKRVGQSPALHTHTELGDTMLYFVIPMLVVTALLVVVHVREQRGKPLMRVLTAAVAVLAVFSGVAATVQVYRIGESGARATWGDKVASLGDELHHSGR